MRDYKAALQSHQRALAILIELFGEEHESTADSYRELGVTQHQMKDWKAALQSKQRALAIRIKLFGDEHDAVGGLTESYFPTNEVRRLEMKLRDETRAYIKFFEEVSSDICEIKAILHSTKEANKEDTKNFASEAQAEYATILSGVSADINVLKQMSDEDTASREVIARLEKRINELKSGKDERDKQPENSGKKWQTGMTAVKVNQRRGFRVRLPSSMFLAPDKTRKSNWVHASEVSRSQVWDLPW